MSARETIVADLTSSARRQLAVDARADSIIAALSIAGYVIVPREPTDEMMDAFYNTPEDGDTWSAMLAAALHPAKEEQ